MDVRLSVDRFAGDGKTIAVLLTDDGQSVEFLRSLLPKGTHAGDVLKFSIEKDEVATKAVSKETDQIQARFQANDRGGDVTL